MDESLKPNILLITDDEHRWDCFDRTLIPSLQTPNLDRLRQEGLYLPHTYTSCPICMPTRFTWLTGLRASQVHAGLLANAHDWPHDAPTFARQLQQSGYQTALIGKLHSYAWLRPRDVRAAEPETRARGFDHVHEVSSKVLPGWGYLCQYTEHLKERGLYLDYIRDVRRRSPMQGGKECWEPSPLEPDDYVDVLIRQQATSWLRKLRRDRPFFGHLSFCSPHFPLDPPEPWFSRHRPEDMPVPFGVDDPQEIRQWQIERALYASLIELVDEQVGHILDTLDELGLEDNTLVMFTTDHGDQMGDHGLMYKGYPYDASIRTPLIARYPGKTAPGTVSDALCDTTDLPHTILEMAGCYEGDDASQRLLPQSPGRSFAPVLRGEANTHREWIYSECGLRGWRCLRDVNTKYVWRPEGESLFNMSEDPQEAIDFFPSSTDNQRAEWRQKLIASLAENVAYNTQHPWEQPPRFLIPLD